MTTDNAFTVVGLLKACANQKDVCKGSKLHAYTREHHILEKDCYVASSLVSMYARCGAIPKAQRVLEEFPVRNTVMWNAVIAGYVQQGQGERALDCFNQMQQEGYSPDEITFTCALKACGGTGAATKGEEIHDNIVSLGMLKKNTVLGNALVDMYAKCGALAKAQKVLQEIPVRDSITWNSLIAGYTQQGQGEEALKCFDEMCQECHPQNAVTFTCVLKACGSIGAVAKGKQIHDKIDSLGMLKKDIVLGNSLIGMYAKCGAVAKAQQVLEDLSVRDVVTWNVLITEYAQRGQGEEALKCFDIMQCEGHCPDLVSFTYALKACGSIGATAKGEQIHEKIFSLGMLEKNIVLGNALVDMYVKCGILFKAQKVLEVLLARDVATWTTVIAGYVQEGQGEEALKCFDMMQLEGHCPNATTFTCALQACGSIKSATMGKLMHDKIVSWGILENNSELGNSLVDMYSRCCMLAKAEQVLRELPIRNVVSWTTLMTGYAQQGQGEEALKCFDSMQHEGYSPNALTFTCALNACRIIGSAIKGKEMHNKIVYMGMLEKNYILASTLVDMYARCGALSEAQQVLRELPFQDAVAWNALIAGLVQHGQEERALKCFDSMKYEGNFPDVVTFACALKACGNIGAVAKGELIHDDLVSLGMLEKNVVLGNALVDMYARCGAFAKAQQVFEELPVRDASTWAALIAGYVQQGQGEEALECLDNMQCEGKSANDVICAYVMKTCRSTVAKTKQVNEKIFNVGLLHKDVALNCTLLDMYAKCSAFAKVEEPLRELPVSDVFTWTTLMAGYAEQRQVEEALKCFDHMQQEGHFPNMVTLTVALKACGGIWTATKGEKIHDKIVSLGILEKDVVLATTLVDMYVKCGALVKAQQVLEGLPVVDVIAWNTLIGGYVRQGQGEEAMKCFESMQSKGLFPTRVTFICALKACGSMGAVAKGEEIHHKIVSLGMLESIELGNSLVDMYAKCGVLVKAWQVSKQLPVQDVVTWTALLAAYARQGQGEAALKCFDSMQHEGCMPDVVAFACALKACGSLGALAKGEQIHGKIVSLSMLDYNIDLKISLVDMYAEGAAPEKALKVFKGISIQDVVTWNALIRVYAQQGQSAVALHCLEKMQIGGVKPNLNTLTSMLFACSHSGLLDQAEILFLGISTNYSILLDEEHYCCMVDLFGRAGKFNKALQVIEKIPHAESFPVWVALLGACRKWGEVKIARIAFECAANIDKSNSAVYIGMINVYSAAGMQKDGIEIEELRVPNKAKE